jgi:predicted CXXCH cytochrome family protein
MKGDTVTSCLSCHDKPIQKPGDGVVQSVAELAKPDVFKHGPIRDGNCSGCHTLHGGPLPRLLAKPYTEAFYQAFSVDAYALCFSCHDKQLVLAKDTEGLTRFRNGNQNLHFLHVDKPERGRSCYACHMTHASTHPSHIRDSVPYGNWEIPLNFKPTATGGSCAPGCHREAKYDRVQPIPPPSPNPPQGADKKEAAPAPNPAVRTPAPTIGPAGAWTAPPSAPAAKAAPPAELPKKEEKKP